MIPFVERKIMKTTKTENTNSAKTSFCVSPHEARAAFVPISVAVAAIAMPSWLFLLTATGLLLILVKIAGNANDPQPSTNATEMSHQRSSAFGRKRSNFPNFQKNYAKNETSESSV